MRRYFICYCIVCRSTAISSYRGRGGPDRMIVADILNHQFCLEILVKKKGEKLHRYAVEWPRQ
jgi:hypothetical protein